MKIAKIKQKLLDVIVDEKYYFNLFAGINPSIILSYPSLIISVKEPELPSRMCYPPPGLPT